MLAQIGVVPDEVRPPEIDETPLKGEEPRPYCLRIARAKVDAMALGAEEVALCADTTVGAGRRILGKPKDRTEAAAFLALLSGRRHRVITAIALRRGEQVWLRDVVSTVRMKRLSEREIAWYLDGGEWEGKAGGYGIQGAAGVFIPWISGSHTAIMGLPLCETAGLLEAAGYSWSEP